MNDWLHRGAASVLLVLLASEPGVRAGSAAELRLELVGTTVTPHVIAERMRYGKAPDPELGARVQLFLRNAGAVPLQFDAASPVTVRGGVPADLLARDQWTWHDFPEAWRDDPLELPPGALTVWSFNGKRSDWGVGTTAELRVAPTAGQPTAALDIEIARPTAWISAVTFLASDGGVTPDELIVHVANEGDAPLALKSCRLWLPDDNAHWRSLNPQPLLATCEFWPAGGEIPAHDKGILRAHCGPLPLSYAAIELEAQAGMGAPTKLWTHLRVKREAFDISGGWVQGGNFGQQCMTHEPFLKTLRRLHVNTAHQADHFPGYSDQTAPGGLDARYPLKYFNALTPPEKYETPEMLARIHAVEFLGEPQYGGGRPVPPMEVWQKLAPYQKTRLATTITHSEERIWRYYAGLSDYPHYDAYRVCCPAPDAWHKYDRWDGVKLGWGAPLETIGDICRTLRDIKRPLPTAYWSQGPHEGWSPTWGRRRASPTPDELRMQAYHALSSRITSLYWFNLSLKSLLKYRDTLGELTRVGREMELLGDWYLEGDAYRYQRVLDGERLDWDLASIAGPRGVLLFALDLAYRPDRDERVFVFDEPRAARWQFALPAYARQPVEVFRVDGDGVYDVEYQLNDAGLEIADARNKVGIYVAALQAGTRAKIEARRQQLVQYEADFQFDPAGNDADYEALRDFLRGLK